MLSQILPVLKELSAEPQDPAGVPVAAMNQQVPAQILMREAPL